jgi:hypothetical protein
MQIVNLLSPNSPYRELLLEKLILFLFIKQRNSEVFG